ncbi:hypothetical protein Tco_0830023 [Tanacetum coccineum]
MSLWNLRLQAYAFSYLQCTHNLSKLEAHLGFNWEKCHFMVTKGIVLGHKVSSTGLEVDKKGVENVAADHLSRLENLNLEELRDKDIDDNFPDETLMNISTNEEIPWFAHFTNYLVGKILRKGLTYAQRCKFFSDLKHYFWDKPYLFKMCLDGMIRRCVYVSETQRILNACPRVKKRTNDAKKSS